MSEKVIRKEFPLDIDDLVDHVLSALRSNGWNLAKMQYEMACLTANQKQKIKHDEASIAVTFELIAKWKDLGDGIELELTVQEPEHDWTNAECAERCSAIMDAMPEDKTYDTLYSRQPDFIMDEFESNN